MSGRNRGRGHHGSSVGLDQLGPVHYAGDGLILPTGKGKKRTLGARARSSVARRNVKITLPRLPRRDDDGGHR